MDIFITGTDTDIGKTFVTAGIAALMQSLGYNMGVFKPLQSGADTHNGFLTSPDLSYVKSLDPNIKTKCSYHLIAPTAPSVAAALEGVKIDKQQIYRDFEYIKDRSDIVMVEGAGGLMVPICGNFLMSDLAKLLKLRILIVARPDLGTINHTLLTIQAAQSLGLEVAGVIINNYPAGTDDIAIKTAPKIIKDLSGVDIVGIIPKIELHNGVIAPETILDAIINNVDLQKVFNMKIPKLTLV